MIFHFKKEVLTKKPKRWYAMNPAIPSLIWVDSFIYPMDETEALKQSIKNAGFDNWLHTEKLNRTPGGWYRRQNIFMYFQSPIEEARFMLWASGGVEV
jgi:hypothetical protein